MRLGFVALPIVVALIGDGAQATRKKRTHADLVDVRELVAAVDKAMKGDFVAHDASLRMDHHFLRAPEGKTYVPFTIAIEDVQEEAFRSVAVYLRVAKHGDRETSTERDRRIGPTGANVPVFAYDSAAEASAALRLLDRPDARHPGPYPFEAVHFAPLQSSRAAQPRILRRAFAVPPGTYDVYVALRERESSVARGRQPRSTLLKRELEVPDFWVRTLAMSSVIAAARVDPIAQALGADEQVQRPYALGTVELVPAPTEAFRPSDTLTVVFFVYNAGTDARGKPDVSVEYDFYQLADRTQPFLRFFNRTAPQRFNADSLPAEFDRRAGHAVIPMQSISLTSFPPGDYLLEIRVVDQIAAQTISETLRFRVS